MTFSIIFSVIKLQFSALMSHHVFRSASGCLLGQFDAAMHCNDDDDGVDAN